MWVLFEKQLEQLVLMIAFLRSKKCSRVQFLLSYDQEGKAVGSGDVEDEEKAGDEAPDSPNNNATPEGSHSS